MSRVTPGLRQRPSGNWQARYYDPSGKLRGKTFARKSDARSFLDSVKTDVRRGTWVDPAKSKKRFDELATEWLEGRDSDLIRPSTMQRQEIAVRLHLIPHFGARPVADIDYTAVKGFLTHLKDAGLAPATRTKYLGILKRILDEALKSKAITHNPCSLVQGPGTKTVKRSRFLEPAEVNQLAAAISPRYRALVLLSGYRGLRWAELAGLKVERLDLMHATISVEEILVELNGQFHFGRPKTDESIRKVLLPPFLVRELTDHQQNFPPRGGLVFTGQRGAPLSRSSFARSIWKPALKRAGLEEELTFHCLRHSAASLLIADGAQLSELREILGWSKSSMGAMAARYGHLYGRRDEMLTQATETAYWTALKRQEHVITGKIAPMPG